MRHDALRRVFLIKFRKKLPNLRYPRSIFYKELTIFLTNPGPS